MTLSNLSMWIKNIIYYPSKLTVYTGIFFGNLANLLANLLQEFVLSFLQSNLSCRCPFLLHQTFWSWSQKFSILVLSIDEASKRLYWIMIYHATAPSNKWLTAVIKIKFSGWFIKKKFFFFLHFIGSK